MYIIMLSQLNLQMMKGNNIIILNFGGIYLRMFRLDVLAIFIF